MKEQTAWQLSNQTITLPLLEDYSNGYFIWKRIIDLVLATAALLILAPLMVCIAILIRLDSPGPIFFVQKRVSARRQTRNGHSFWEPYTFDFYKFRTMWSNVDETLHRQYMEAYIAGDQVKMANIQPDAQAAKSFKLAGDPRVTRIGKYLRQTSLDELPQLWNVITGEMSLVGPRPPILYEVEKYSAEQLQRLAMVPGITGLSQVSGRCKLSFDDTVRLDLAYIEKQSFLLDLKIVLLTPLAIISQKGAG